MTILAEKVLPRAANCLGKGGVPPFHNSERGRGKRIIDPAFEKVLRQAVKSPSSPINIRAQEEEKVQPKRRKRKRKRGMEKGPILSARIPPSTPIEGHELGKRNKKRSSGKEMVL